MSFLRDDVPTGNRAVARCRFGFLVRSDLWPIRIAEHETPLLTEDRTGTRGTATARSHSSCGLSLPAPPDRLAEIMPPDADVKPGAEGV